MGLVLALDPALDLKRDIVIRGDLPRIENHLGDERPHIGRNVVQPNRLILSVPSIFPKQSRNRATFPIQIVN